MTLTAVAFDISWFFGGLEQYSLIVLRNTAVKLVGIAMLFLFIRKKEDLLLYVALTAATGLLGNISMWGYLKGQVERPVLKELCPLRHLKETLVYFIPTIATSVYTILDKTMLGWFSGENKSQNGYYEYATGFVNMAKILIMSFNAVMSARMSYLFGNGRIEEVHERIRDSLDFVLLMAMPIMLGLAGDSQAQFIPWFLGNGYLPVTFLMYVCSPLVLVVGLSDCIGSQILTPGGKRAQSGKVDRGRSRSQCLLKFPADPSFCGFRGCCGFCSGRVLYHISLSVAGKRFYKTEDAGALWLETACGSCSYAGSCGMDRTVFGTGPWTWTDHYLCTDRSRGSGIFPGASGYA